MIYAKYGILVHTTYCFLNTRISVDSRTGFSIIGGYWLRRHFHVVCFLEFSAILDLYMGGCQEHYASINHWASAHQVTPKIINSLINSLNYLLLTHSQDYLSLRHSKNNLSLTNSQNHLSLTNSKNHLSLTHTQDHLSLRRWKNNLSPTNS